MTRTADLLTHTTLDDSGRTINRFTDFRAVIDHAAALDGQLTVRIEAHDAQHDESCCDGGHVVYLFEADIPGAHVNGDPDVYVHAAAAVLAEEGFEPSGDWTVMKPGEKYGVTLHEAHYRLDGTAVRAFAADLPQLISETLGRLSNDEQGRGVYRLVEAIGERVRGFEDLVGEEVLRHGRAFNRARRS